jgi:hypothetical protein
MRSRQKNARKIIAAIVSISSWIFVFTTLIWFGASLFSFTFINLSNEDVYIPDTVKMSYYSFIILICWIIFVFFIAMSWQKYNSYILQKQSKHEEVNRTNNLVFMQGKINWSEAVISNVPSLNILDEVDVMKNNLKVVHENEAVSINNLRKMEAHKLLSLATSFMKKRDYTTGLSILRVLLEHEDASPIILKVSKIKMSQCIYELGYNGIANSLAE